MSRKALGRGLGALIPPAPQAEPESFARQDDTAAPMVGTPAPETGDGTRTVALDQIRANPYQPRSVFNAEAISELSRSIKENGLIQPLVVRRLVEGGFELIAGERRFLASKEAGLTEVPVVVRNATRREMLEMALVENLQREDLNPVEEAEAYQRLATEFGLTQEEIGERVGKSRTTVTNALRLLSLESSIRDMVVAGELSAGHARALLSVPEAKRANLAKQTAQHGWSVREIEAQVREVADSKGKKTAAKRRSAPVIEAWEEKLRAHFGTQVRIVGGTARGRVELHYFNEDDLERILELTGVGSGL